jgi:hypothetical protein
VIRQSRRTPRRAQPGLQSSIRVRSSGLGLLTGVAIVGVLALAVSDGRVASPGATHPDLQPTVVAGTGTGAVAAAQRTGAAVPDVPWLVQRPDGAWVYGRGARSTPRTLPSDETGLAISEQWVASVVPVASGGSTVRFRDRDSGRAVADVRAPIWVSAGAWSSAGLVVTGYVDRSMSEDGGIVLISPAASTVTVLVPGGPFDAKLGRPVARGDVVVSPSGRLVAANACGIRICDTQVVDVVTGSISRPIRAGEGFLRVLTDEAIVTTDGDARWISSRRIADGAELWRHRDSVLLDPVATADGSVVAVTGSQRTGWGVASFDARGAVRTLGPRSSGGQAWPRIWTALSGTSTIVVAGQPFAEWVESTRSLSVTVLGLGGGRTTSASATVRLPAPAEAVR